MVVERIVRADVVDRRRPTGEVLGDRPQLRTLLRPRPRLGCTDVTNIDKVIKEKKLAATATVQPRYAKNITFDAKPATAIATVAEGSRGLTGGEEKKPAEAEKKEEPKKEEPKKSGGLLGRFKPSSGSQAQQSQTVASAGARGVNPDRDAVGGPNKKRVPVKIGQSDIAEFQKGIA